MSDLRETPYAKELARAVRTYSAGNEIRLERLFVKGKGQEEIRLSWWRDGRMMQRPADLPEEDLVEIVARGLRRGVLTEGLWKKILLPIRRSDD